MAKKQTRRSISVSRTTYERLKAFCETNNISMSQLVETRVNDFLGPSDLKAELGSAAPTMMPGGTATRFSPRPMVSGAMPRPLDARTVSHPAGPAGATPPASHRSPVPAAAPASSSSSSSGSSAASSVPPGAPPAGQSAPMTSAAARFAVEPPPPIIKPRQETAAPKPAEKRPEQIFTF